MRRDRRLLIALLWFAGSSAAWAIQIWIAALYIDAAVMRDWTWFGATFSVELPAAGPDRFCFDYCAPEFPFIAGWIGIAAFLAGSVMLAIAWWKPSSTDMG